MPELYTSNFANIDKILERTEHPLLLSIARFVKPELQAQVHGCIKEFYPNEHIIKRMKHGSISNADFTNKYYAVLDESLKDKNVADLFNKSEYSEIFLLCYEKSHEFCHRHLLRDYLYNKYNLIFEEYWI